MNLYYQFLFVIVTLFAIGANAEEPRVAVALLVNSPNVTGSITFTEVDSGTHVTGTVIGLAAGAYGFHIHELGDISTCDATGAHFDLDGNNHGGRDHDVRHIGDLGNVVFVENETTPFATLDFVDTLITLRGHNNILGRAVVLHEQEDDLGLGGHEASLTTGNAGARVACGVIGIKSPAGPWNAAISIGPSTALMLSVLWFLKYFNYIAL